MADNTPQNAAATIATDDVGGVHYQIVKNAFGALDTATLVTATSGLPTTDINQSTGPTAFSATDAVGGAPDGIGTPVNAASTAGSIVSLAVPAGLESWTMQLTGYGTGTIYTEGSIDSTNGTDGNWVALKGRRTGTAVGVESIVYAVVANGVYRGNCGGITYLRARLIGTGTPSVKFVLSAGSGATFLNSGIPSGTSSIGTVINGAGSALMGKVGLDQTTPGTTNAVSISQVGATTIATGNGVVGAGVQRVAIASDTTFPALPTGTNTIGSVKITDGTNVPAVKAGVAAAVGDNTLVVTLHPSSAATATQPVSLASNTPIIATGTNTIGKVGIDQTTPGTTNAVTNTPATPTASIINSAATTNATSIKASAGTLYSITVSNAGAAAAFVKIYNLAVAPTVGTSVIALTIPIAASGMATIDFGALGMRFGTGIALAITNLVGEADATAVAANQVKVLTSYI